MNKICATCSIEKDLHSFPSKGKKCKACRAKYLRELRSKPGQKEKRKEYRKKNRNKINEQKRQSYIENASAIIIKHKEYYKNNTDYIKDRQRKYQANKETKDYSTWLSKCMKHAKSGDKKYNREFDLDLAFLLNLLDKQNKRCAITNVDMSHERNSLIAISIDRIDSKIGHIKTNIQLVCSAINRAKREYSNDDTLSFVLSIIKEFGNVKIRGFDGFSYPESTVGYSMAEKYAVENKLRSLFSDFQPPQYCMEDLKEDIKFIADVIVGDYLINGEWRSHKPSNKLFAGRKLIRHFHPHLWKVRTQGKPLIPEVWGQGKIFDKSIFNLINGKTKISFNRIIRELIYAGAAIPSQMHPGFAKSVLSHFAADAKIVYDPFAGWGARMLACQSLSMEYEGYELSMKTWEGLCSMSKFVDYSPNILHADSFLYEVPPCDVMFTSPPFGTEEYIGSQSSVDLDNLLDRTSSIPLRIIHLPFNICKKYGHTIPINARLQANNEMKKEGLLIL